MNQDPAYQKLQEIAWRRPLTAVEQAELDAWLAQHPDAQSEAETEAALTHVLNQLPDAPLPSNFTARVLQAVQQEENAARRKTTRPTWRIWRGFLPRLVGASLLVLGGFAFWQHRAAQQQQLAATAREVAEARLLVDPVLAKDFEIIAGLTPSEMVADDSLLAMSEDLLALGQ